MQWACLSTFRLIGNDWLVVVAGVRAATRDGEMEMLKDQVVQLDREKRQMTVQWEKERERAEDAQNELCTAREEIRKSKEETKNAKIERKGDQLKILTLEYEALTCPASHHHQVILRLLICVAGCI